MTIATARTRLRFQARPPISITFFAYEWINPRRGKVIHEIRLKGTTRFRGGSGDFNNDWGPVIASNAVILAALSVVKKRPGGS